MDWHWPRSVSLSTASQGLSRQKHALEHTHINTLTMNNANSGATQSSVMHNQRTHSVNVVSSKWAAPTTITKQCCTSLSVIIFFLDYCFLRSHTECVYACQHLCGAHWIKGHFFLNLLLLPHLSQPLESHNSGYQSRRLTTDTVSRMG